MTIADLQAWQVFVLREGSQPAYEHVILPAVLLEKLEPDHTIVKERMGYGGWRVPVNAVRLVSMSWVQLDGTLEVHQGDLRTHANAYRQHELHELLGATKRINRAWLPVYMTAGHLVPNLDLATGQLSQTGRAPAQPPDPENLSRKQVEKLSAKPAKPSPWKPPAKVTTQVDLSCLADKATLQLFAGTVVVRDIADGAMFGLRNKLRRAKK